MHTLPHLLCMQGPDPRNFQSALRLATSPHGLRLPTELLRVPGIGRRSEDVYELGVEVNIRTRNSHVEGESRQVLESCQVLGDFLCGCRPGGGGVACMLTFFLCLKENNNSCSAQPRDLVTPCTPM